MKQEISIDRREHSFSVLGRVDEMRRDEQFCDFIIKVGSEEIHAHRIILAGGSDYLNAMFSHDTKEKKSGVVEMQDVDPECTVICVDHIYGGEVHLPDGKYEEMMHVAVLMQLHTLRDAISCLLEENLDPKSFFITRKIASMYGCKKLEEKCKEFAEENFLAITKKEEFEDLEKNFIMELIKSKNMKISEKEKLDALLRWVEYDSERCKFLMEILKFVNLSEVSTEHRRYLIEREPLINKSLEASLYFSISVMDTMKIRIEDPAVSTASFAVFDTMSGYLQRFNATDNAWSQMQKMTEEMRGEEFSAISLGGNIFVLMGNRSVYRLNYFDDAATWDKMADMIEDHGERPPAVGLSGSIYVIGGHLARNTKVVERYDSSMNQWTRLPDRPRSSDGSVLIVSKGCIYCFGGRMNSKYVRNVERFDPTLSDWLDLAPMNEAKGYMAVTELNGMIYIMGGNNGKSIMNTVECYDTVTNRCTTITSMLGPRWLFRGFLLYGKIYAVGGIESPDVIEKYDPEGKTWETVKIPSGVSVIIKECVTLN